MRSEPRQKSDGGYSDTFITALTAELARRSDLVWVSANRHSGQAMWHVWHESAVALVTGGLEQRNPGLVDGEAVTVTLRSKENGSRQLQLDMRARLVPPGTPEWTQVVAALHPKRLNPPDGERQPDRWSEESDVWLLVPCPDTAELPDSMSDDALREEPRPTTAITRVKNPLHLGRATRKRRPLG